MRKQNERERTPIYNFQPSDSVPSLHKRTNQAFFFFPFPLLFEFPSVSPLFSTTRSFFLIVASWAVSISILSPTKEGKRGMFCFVNSKNLYVMIEPICLTLQKSVSYTPSRRRERERTVGGDWRRWSVKPLPTLKVVFWSCIWQMSDPVIPSYFP